MLTDHSIMKLLLHAFLSFTLNMVSLHAYYDDLRECNVGEYILDHEPCNGTCPANRCLRTWLAEAGCVLPIGSCDSALGYCTDYLFDRPPDFPEEVCPACEDDGAFIALCDGKPICTDVPCGQSGGLFCPTPVGGREDSRRLCEVPGEYAVLITSFPQFSVESSLLPD